MHGPADALAYGVKVTGCTLFVVDDGVDTGPIVAQAAVRVEDDDTVEIAARADQGGRARDARRSVGRMARRGGASGAGRRASTIRRTGGPPGSEQTTPGAHGEVGARDSRIPIKRALVSVYDKSGLEELVRGLHERRRGPGLHRRLGRADRGARPPGHQGRGPDRVPGVPRRPGQDAAPQGARRDPGRPAARLPRPAARRSWASSRSTSWSPTSTRSARPCSPARRPDECVEQIDIGGPSMVRAAAKNHPSVAIVTSPARYADVLAAVAAGRLHAGRSGSGWPPRRSSTPRRTTSRWRAG